MQEKARESSDYLQWCLLETERLWPPVLGGRRLVREVSFLLGPPCILIKDGVHTGFKLVLINADIYKETNERAIMIINLSCVAQTHYSLIFLYTTKEVWILVLWL